MVAPWPEVARSVPELADNIPGTGACLDDLTWLLFPGLYCDRSWAAWQPVAGLHSGLRNCALGRDARFCRTAPGVFGLAEWALPANRSIREHLIEQITASGRQQARLGPIADELAGRFGVRKSSVYARARGPEFTGTGSMISLASPVAASGKSHTCVSRPYHQAL